jgi:ABC-type phosphate transport system permease subunit
MDKQRLPNATLVLVMGILSIVGCCFYSIPGFIFGIIALVVGKKATNEYNEAPDNYTGIENVKAGKIMAIIGMVISLLYLIMIIGVIVYFGWETFQDPELMQQKLEELQNLQ